MGKSGDKILLYIESQSYDWSDLGLDERKIIEKVKDDLTYNAEEEIIESVAIVSSRHAPSNYLDVFSTIDKGSVVKRTSIDLDSTRETAIYEIQIREASEMAYRDGKISRIVTTEEEKAGLSLTEKQTLGRYAKQLR